MVQNDSELCFVHVMIALSFLHLACIHNDLQGINCLYALSILSCPCPPSLPPSYPNASSAAIGDNEDDLGEGDKSGGDNDNSISWQKCTNCKLPCYMWNTPEMYKRFLHFLLLFYSFFFSFFFFFFTVLFPDDCNNSINFYCPPKIGISSKIFLTFGGFDCL